MRDGQLDPIFERFAFMAKREHKLKVFRPRSDDPIAVSAVVLGALHMAAELSSDFMARLNAIEDGTAVGQAEWAGSISQGIVRLERLHELVELQDLDEYTESDPLEKKIATVQFFSTVSRELWQELQRLLFDAFTYLQKPPQPNIVVDASGSLPHALASAMSACAEEILFDEAIFDEESLKRSHAIKQVAELPRLTLPLGKDDSADVMGIPVQTDALIAEAFQQAKRIFLLDNYIRRIRLNY